MSGEEVWVPVGIPGYGEYQVSNTGKIRNRAGKVLSPYLKHGDVCINLWLDGSKKTFKLEVLLASASLKWVRPAHVQAASSDPRRPVNQYDMNGNFVATYPSIKEAAQAVGCHPRNITSNARNVSKSASGFVWKYVDDAAQTA